MVLPYAGNEREWWVVFQNHLGQKKFFSSHHTEVEAELMARQQDSVAAEIAESESKTAERQIDPDHYYVIPRPQMVQVTHVESGTRIFHVVENKQVPLMHPDPNWASEE